LPEEVDEVILVVGYLAGKIKGYFGDSYAGRKIFYVEQRQLNGTGGAVHLAKDLLGDEFLVMMGDDLYMSKDIKKLMQHDVAILALEGSNPAAFASIRTDAEGNAVDIIEKPETQELSLTNTGAYKLKKDFFNYELVDGGKGEFWLPQTILKMRDKYDVVVEKATDWFPIGDPEALSKAQKIISKFI
jgi:NDP-sugar pyrophosphorylase family protein